VLEARAEVIRLASGLLTETGVTEEVAREAETLVRTFEQAGDDRAAKVWRSSRLGPGFVAGPERRFARRARDRIREAGGHAPHGSAESQPVRRRAFFGPMPVPDAIRVCEEILGSWASNGDPRSALRALAGLKAMAGAFAEARELVAAHKEIVQELGLRTRRRRDLRDRRCSRDPAAAERELGGDTASPENGETQNFPDLGRSWRTRSMPRATTGA
jgi:hypothetical protein